jgi:dipeptidyl aminopeptidase/acylaminoacyl peptidase
VKTCLASSVVAAAAVCASVTLPAGAQGRKAITHEAMWMLPRVGAPAVSPDGRWAVFLVTEPAYTDKDQRSDLWIVPVDGSAQPRRLTFTSGGESSVAWSRDSRRIAFVARRDGDEQNQIYALDVTASGEAVRLTSISTGAGFPAWRPDGQAILFSSLVYPGAATDADNKRIADERQNRKYNVRIFDAFPVRRWDRWLDDRQLHLFVQELTPQAQARDLLAGTKLVEMPGYAARGLDSGEQLEAVWSPAGESIVFTATTRRDAAAHTGVATHLFEVKSTGGEPRQLTSGTSTYSNPRFRPDGRALAFIVADEHDQIYSLDRLGSGSWPWSGEARTITARFDRSVATWGFSADSRSIFLTAEDAGLEKIYTMPAGGGEVQLAVEPARGVYTNLAAAEAATGTVLVANWGSSIEPAEVVRVEPAAKRHVPLTSFAVAPASAIDWQPLQHFWFTSTRGKRIHSMIALPPAFDPARKYPLLVEIHGGAANMWRDQITLRWNYHLLAQPGYVVLLTDYTGSTGYGEQFARDIRYDPFVGPAGEINEAADEAIQRFPFIDGTRQAAAGASYGGHLVNWLAGTTTRYRALVSHAGLANSEAQWGTSDSIYHRELMAGGPPWMQTETWRNQNPIRNAASFKTPMLLSVGERDYRVPLNNTLEMWSALQRMQVPSRLLVWPDENHWILNGENSRVFYREVHAWLARWLASPAAPSGAAHP